MILGCAGKSLPKDEIGFYRGEAALGLHPVCPQHRRARADRAIWSPSMRDSVGRPRCAGVHRPGGRPGAAHRGRRSRPNYPAGTALGALYRDDHDAGLRAAWLMARLHAFDLSRFGITRRLPAGARRADRGRQRRDRHARLWQGPATVTALGRAAAEGLMAGGVLPVMKHIPGHGRAFSDTHFELPTRRHAARRTAAARFRAVQGAGPPADGDDRACRLQRRSTRSSPATTSGKVIERDHPRRDRLRRAADQRRHLDEGTFWGFPDKGGGDPCGGLRYGPSLQWRDGGDGAASPRARRGLRASRWSAPSGR